MRRKETWPVDLHDFIKSREATPFQWGHHDCCLFACDAIKVVTGIDPAWEVYRGQYDSALTAARLLAASGGVEGIAAMVCESQGFLEINAAYIQRGDVGLVDLDASGNPVAPDKADQSALGVCEGGDLVFPGAVGLVRLPVKLVRRAWRIQ